MEPTALALQAVVEAVAEHALVMVDPNCRPTFIPDRESYRRSLAATLRYAHVVKVSLEDLGYLEPSRAPEDAARALLDDGPGVVLVTLGGEGALIVTAAGEEAVPRPGDRGRRHDRRRRRVRRRLPRPLAAEGPHARRPQRRRAPCAPRRSSPAPSPRARASAPAPPRRTCPSCRASSDGLPLRARHGLDERPERAALPRGRVPPVLPAQPGRRHVGEHLLGPRGQPRPRALGGAAGGHPARRPRSWSSPAAP